MPLFLHLIFFFRTYNSFTHPLSQQYSPRLLSILPPYRSAQWHKPPWGAEPGFELGPALQHYKLSLPANYYPIFYKAWINQPVFVSRADRNRMYDYSGCACTARGSRFCTSRENK
jgi:hypothetical protein